jgi:hypothetical protein
VDVGDKEGDGAVNPSEQDAVKSGDSRMCSHGFSRREFGPDFGFRSLMTVHPTNWILL